MNKLSIYESKKYMFIKLFYPDINSLLKHVLTILSKFYSFAKYILLSKLLIKLSELFLIQFKNISFY